MAQRNEHGGRFWPKRPQEGWKASANLVSVVKATASMKFRTCGVARRTTGASGICTRIPTDIRRLLRRCLGSLGLLLEDCAECGRDVLLRRGRKASSAEMPKIRRYFREHRRRPPRMSCVSPAKKKKDGL